MGGSNPQQTETAQLMTHIPYDKAAPLKYEVYQPNPNIPVAGGKDEQGNIVTLTPEQKRLMELDKLAAQQKAGAVRGTQEAYNAQKNAEQMKAFESTYPNAKEATTSMSPNSYGRESSKPASSEDAIEKALREAEKY